jgi:sec-independent protein translocase protein TatA
MQLPGGWEWIIILIVVLLLFGPGRLSKIAGEIGRGIREFRSGLREMDEEEETSSLVDEPVDNNHNN